MTSYIISEEQLNLALDNMFEFCTSGELKKVHSTNLEMELQKKRDSVIDKVKNIILLSHCAGNCYCNEKLDAMRSKIITEPKQPICPWCFKDHKKENSLSWDQFKEVWVCSSHGKFDESQLKHGI